MSIRRTILLSGPSASGKSTLARALCAFNRRVTISTSAYLKSLAPPNATSAQLFEFGKFLDDDKPLWLPELIREKAEFRPAVVDAIRSETQLRTLSGSWMVQNFVRVNVTAGLADLSARHASRGTSEVPTPYMFPNPDFTWDSSRLSLSTAVQVLEQLSGSGHVDVIIGGQYGSEGKGKLAAHLASRYDILVRSGGPNAGHWVRDEDYEFCFHQIPSGAMANRYATCVIAAGATLNPEAFLEEVSKTGTAGRLAVDPNTVLISENDRMREHSLVAKVGSTAQGVGVAAARRIMRGLAEPVMTAGDDPRFAQWVGTTPTSRWLSERVDDGARVLLEGTQGSALSLYHGPFPYTTSRDTNSPGLISEVGVPPSSLRDTWLVLRTYPIRVGGNSGPMENETTWEEIAIRTGQDPVLLRSKERTSTTNRQRRVAEFDWGQFAEAIRHNRPNKLFLTFGDYLDPGVAGAQSWSVLTPPVLDFVRRLEQESGALVAGVSTGPRQSDTAWRVEQ